MYSSIVLIPTYHFVDDDCVSFLVGMNVFEIIPHVCLHKIR